MCKSTLNIKAPSVHKVHFTCQYRKRKILQKTVNEKKTDKNKYLDTFPLLLLLCENVQTKKLLNMFSLKHTVYYIVAPQKYFSQSTYLEYHSDCPLVGIRTPPPPSRLRVRGWGSPNSDDWRESLVLCLLCGIFRLTVGEDLLSCEPLLCIVCQCNV
jgi:hypothetical protein